MDTDIQIILNKIRALEFQLCCLRNQIKDINVGLFVESVTGDIVDNIDPFNPIILTPDLQTITDIGATTTNELTVQLARLGADNRTTFFGQNTSFGSFVGVNLLGYEATATSNNQTVLGNETNPIAIYHGLFTPPSATLTTNYLKVDIAGNTYYIRLYLDAAL